MAAPARINTWILSSAQVFEPFFSFSIHLLNLVVIWYWIKLVKGGKLVWLNDNGFTYYLQTHKVPINMSKIHKDCKWVTREITCWQNHSRTQCWNIKLLKLYIILYSNNDMASSIPWRHGTLAELLLGFTLFLKSAGCTRSKWHTVESPVLHLTICPNFWDRQR